MRGIYFVGTLIVLSFLFYSCKKEKSLSSHSSIIGSWELRAYYNGQGGVTNYSAGNGTLLKYTATTYQTISNGVLQKSGTYRIIKDTFHLLGDIRDRIIYDNEYNSVRTFVSLSSDSLLFSIDAYDGPGAKYMKLGNQ